MSSQPSPGWYSDPFGRFERRYWRGTWTEHVTSQGLQSKDAPLIAPPISDRPVSRFPAGWHPDPFGRFEHRYWDGAQWTQQVSVRGRQAVDPPVHTHPAAVLGDPRVQQQVRRAGVPSRAMPSESPLLTEPVLVVNQKAKLFERSAEYAVFDRGGRRLGTVREVDQRFLKKAMGGGGANGTHRFQVVDVSGQVVLSLLRPAKVLKSKMVVIGVGGAQGEIVQKNVGVFTGVRFGLRSGGDELGTITAASWREWDFGIQDAGGSEIARITKTWAGWTKERFTKADNYVVQIHRPLQEPLRSLVLASALAIDTALKQGDPTSGSGRSRRYK